MTTWLQTTIKLAPDNGCFTDPQDGSVICPLPCDPFPAAPVAITPSWEWYAVSDCLPTTLDGVVACPLHLPTEQATGTSLDSALAQMASADALAPRIPDSFFDGGAPVDFASIFVAAALLAGVAASGVALLLAKKRRKNIAKQEATA